MQNYDFDSGRDRIGQLTEQDKSVSSFLDNCEKLITGRQLEIFQLIRQGATNAQIALILGIRKDNVRSSVRHFRNNIRKRYGGMNLNNHTMADYLKGAI